MKMQLVTEAPQRFYGERLAEEIRRDDALRVAVEAMFSAFEDGDVGELDEGERRLNEYSRNRRVHWLRGAYRCVTRPDLGPVYVVEPMGGFPCRLAMLASEY